LTTYDPNEAITTAHYEEIARQPTGYRSEYTVIEKSISGCFD